MRRLIWICFFTLSVTIHSIDSAVAQKPIEADVVRRIAGIPSECITTLEMSSSGEFVAAGTTRGDVMVYQINSGECVAKYGAHLGGVLTLQFSGDDAFLASCGANGTVEVRQADGWRRVFFARTLDPGKFCGVNAAVIRSKSMEIVSGMSLPWDVRRWNLKSGESKNITASSAVFANNELDIVRSIALSPDGSQLAVLIQNGIVSIDWASQKTIAAKRIPIEDTGFDVRFLARDKVITGGNCPTVVRTTNGEIVKTFTARDLGGGWARRLDVSTKCNVAAILTESGDESVYIMFLNTDTLSWQGRLDCDNGTSLLAISGDGSRIATSQRDFGKEITVLRIRGSGDNGKGKSKEK